jgi:hypothetical protein
MSDMKADQTWGMLADLEEEEGQTKLLQRYTDLASLPEGERASQMLTMTTAEYDPPDDKLPTFTPSRLSVWLGMVAGVAQNTADAYHAATFKIPGPHAMRRVSMIQTLADAFSRGSNYG